MEDLLVKSPDSDSDEDPGLDAYMEDRAKLFKNEGFQKGEDGIYTVNGQPHPFMRNIIDRRAKKQEKFEDSFQVNLEL